MSARACLLFARDHCVSDKNTRLLSIAVTVPRAANAAVASISPAQTRRLAGIGFSNRKQNSRPRLFARPSVTEAINEDRTERGLHTAGN